MSDPTPLPQREDNDNALGLCQAVLFDLDGTLADTAPDLAAAVNKMRHDRGLEMVPLENLRPLASAGARGLIGAAFGIGPDDHEFASMREEFLANYEADLCIETTLFPGIPELLDDLDARGVRWGIVTNKVARLTEPLVAQLGLEERAGCVVSGDTTPHSKPHPGAAAARGTRAGRGAGAHRLCRRRSARRAGGFRGRHENHRGGLWLLRQRHSADAVACAACRATRRPNC